MLDRSELASADNAAKGAYVLAEASEAQPQVLLIATGSEVQIALDARARLEAEGTPTRVVSAPCLEWFAEQTAAYRQEVLPPAVRARVSVEAAVPMGWREYVGEYGEIVGLDHFGASADYQTLYEQFGPDRRTRGGGRPLEPVQGGLRVRLGHHRHLTTTKDRSPDGRTEEKT